jgi:hypothetical protein
LNINLLEIPCYVITVNPRREAFVKGQLARVGITPTFVQGVKCQPGIVGCGLSHLRILREKHKPPFLVLEDDVAVTEDFRPIIELPNPSEEPCPGRVYLGISTWGIRPTEYARGINHAARVTRVNDEWLEVHNMLSGHAILYVSWSYVGILTEMVTDKLTHGIPFDIAFAEYQGRGAAWTPNRPFFYQSAEVGGNEADTRQPLPQESLILPTL